jgi:hypothetical protein
MTAAGWYDDPANPGQQLRFFDGQAWTDHVSAYPEGAAPAQTPSVVSPPMEAAPLQPTVRLGGPDILSDGVGGAYVPVDGAGDSDVSDPHSMWQSQRERHEHETQQALEQESDSHEGSSRGIGRFVRPALALATVLVFVAVAFQYLGGSPTPAPVALPTPTASEPIDPSPTPTVEPTVEPTPEPTLEPTVEPTPTATATPKPTATATPKPTVTATPKPTVTATPKPTATATVTVDPRVAFASAVSSTCQVNAAKAKASKAPYDVALRSRAEAFNAIASSVGLAMGKLSAKDQQFVDDSILAPLRRAAVLYKSQAQIAAADPTSDKAYLDGVAAALPDRSKARSGFTSLGVTTCASALSGS